MFYMQKKSVGEEAFLVGQHLKQKAQLRFLIFNALTVLIERTVIAVAFQFQRLSWRGDDQRTLIASGDPVVTAFGGKQIFALRVICRGGCHVEQAKICLRPNAVTTGSPLA